MSIYWAAWGERESVRAWVRARCYWRAALQQDCLCGERCEHERLLVKRTGGAEASLGLLRRATWRRELVPQMNQRARDFAIQLLKQMVMEQSREISRKAVYEVANEPPMTWSTEAKKLHDMLLNAIDITARR